MAVVVHDIRATTLVRDSITLTWRIKDTVDDLSTFTVSLWRSEALVGPYTQVSLEMSALDVESFVDTSTNLFATHRDHVYRVRVKAQDESVEWFGSVPHDLVLKHGKDPGGVTLEAPPDLEAAEAIRRFELTMREFAGRRLLQLRRRGWGQHCPGCWDALKRRRSKSHCLVCWDTGYAGGYYAPQEAWAAKPPAQVSSQLTELFEMEIYDTIMWFSARSRLFPGDLLVDAHGDRWRVIQLNPGEKGWSRTRWVAQLRHVTPDQVEYDIPITWDADSLTDGPQRQYVRATDIDSYHEAVRARGLGNEPDRGSVEFPVHTEDA